MSKVRIYIEPKKIGEFIEIKNKELIHKIRDILRIRANDVLYVFNGEGREYLYRVANIEKKNILIKKEKEEKKYRLTAKRIILGFPLLREEKVDFILQKATELGIGGFIPFVCQRSINKKPSTSKLQRWKKIVIEAARQSQRLWLPYIDEPVDFKDILKRQFDAKFVASPKGKNLGDVFDKKWKSIFFIIGPEGDFSFQENTSLKEKGFISLRLSPNILRTETAAILGAGLINYLLSADERKEETPNNK